MLGLSDILLTGPVPPTALIGHYAPWLVFVSFVLIGLAGMIGFDMVAFGLQRESRVARLTWRAIASVTLGVGIWSMHFLAMLAYQQGLDMEYDPLGSAISVLSAVVILGLGLGLVDRPSPSLARVFGFGGVITVAILVMHSIGMAAMDMAMEVRYRPEWIAFGAVVGAPAALAAAWFAFRLAPSLDRGQAAARTAAAAMLALSVCGLHYAAIEGTVMIPLDGLCADFTRNGLNLKLVFAVAAGTLEIGRAHV